MFTRLRTLRLSLSVTLPFFVGVLVGAGSISVAADMLGSAVFGDVQPGSYYDAPVGRLYGQGVIKGAGDGGFHPGDPVTRADVAVMIDRAINGDAGAAAAAPRSRRSSSVSSSSSSASAPAIGAAGAFRFAIDKMTVSEATSTISISIIRYGGKAGAVSVDYKTTNGTAVAPDDFNEATGTVTFADGETSKIITLKAVNDLLGEASEVFTVSLSNPTGGAVLGTPSATAVTLLDNDGGPGAGTDGASSSVNSAAAGGVFTFSAMAYSVHEDKGAVTITVLRQGTASAAANVDYETADGSATAGTHYTKTQGTLSFAAGETSKTFSVQITDNTTIEGNKNVTLKLLKPTSAAVLGVATNIPLTIVDNEATPATASGSVLFSSDSYSATEKGGTATITILRRTNFAGTVSVKYTMNDSTTTVGSDYTNVNGTMTFGPNESSKSFTIPIIKDTTTEPEERLNLVLSEPVGAMLGTQSTAVLKIND